MHEQVAGTLHYSIEYIGLEPTKRRRTCDGWSNVLPRSRWNRHLFIIFGLRYSRLFVVFIASVKPRTKCYSFRFSYGRFEIQESRRSTATSATFTRYAFTRYAFLGQFWPHAVCFTKRRDLRFEFVYRSRSRFDLDHLFLRNTIDYSCGEALQAKPFPIEFQRIHRQCILVFEDLLAQLQLLDLLRERIIELTIRMQRAPHDVLDTSLDIRRCIDRSVDRVEHFTDHALQNLIRDNQRFDRYDDQTDRSERKAQRCSESAHCYRRCPSHNGELGCRGNGDRHLRYECSKSTSSKSAKCIRRFDADANNDQVAKL